VSSTSFADRLSPPGDDAAVFGKKMLSPGAALGYREKPDAAMS
jgi:hypothetical protein